eukprot:scaffold2522_cov59-Phaeocystis_antarctica.AAC.1
MWSAQAAAEGLTLLVAENTTGYFGVNLNQPGRPKPYLARVRRDGSNVSLGQFATAEEAALCVARSPEGQEAAERAAAAPPLTIEEVRQQAQVEGLKLRVADNKTGYFGVYLNYPGSPKPYQVKVRRGGRTLSLGAFATVEEAALCVARSPEGRAAAAERAAAAPPLTSEEVRQQAQAERLTLLKADNKTGYFGVNLKPSGPKPYQARVKRGGKLVVHLGNFATAEQAALCVARSPEGQAAAQSAAVTPAPLTSEEARQQAQAEGLTLRVGRSGRGYFGVHPNNPGQPRPYQAQVTRGGKLVGLGMFATAEEAALRVARSPEGRAAAQKAAAAMRPPTSEEERKGPFAKEEGVVPPMPPDAYVKVEVVVKEEESSSSRPKRRRTE